MSDSANVFTHIHCLKRTKKQVELLSKFGDGGNAVNMYDLVGAWANAAWEEAKKKGLVNDNMLPVEVKAHWIGGVDPAQEGTDKTVVTETPKMMPRKKRVQMLGRDR